MTRDDILARLKADVEGRYENHDVFAGVEVINFELMGNGSLRVYVKVLFLGTWTILHGRINDARDYGFDLTDRERDFLGKTASQAPAPIGSQTVVSKYVMHLVSQLRHLIIPGSDLPRLTGALLRNPNLMDLIIHMDVDLIVAYVERMLNDLACDQRSGTSVSLIASLLSNLNLITIIRNQQYEDDKEVANV